MPDDTPSTGRPVGLDEGTYLRGIPTGDPRTFMTVANFGRLAKVVTDPAMLQPGVRYRTYDADLFVDRDVLRRELLDGD